MKFLRYVMAILVALMASNALLQAGPAGRGAFGGAVVGAGLGGALGGGRGAAAGAVTGAIVGGSIGAAEERRGEGYYGYDNYGYGEDYDDDGPELEVFEY